MTIPIYTYRCNRCSYTQSAGFINPCVYVHPNDEQHPVFSKTGWCHDCDAARDIEDLSPSPRLECLKRLQKTVSSVQKKNRLLFKSWTYNAHLWSNESGWRERITADTYEDWADQLDQAIMSIEFLHIRQSPPRCLSCGGTKIDALFLTAPNLITETSSHDVLLHPGCGGQLELHEEGDMFINGPLSNKRVFS